MNRARNFLAARLEGLWLCLKLLAVIMGVHLLVEPAVERVLEHTGPLQQQVVGILGLACVNGALVWVVVGRPLRLNVAGRSIGVLHAASPPEQPLGPEQTVRLEALATQGGARIGMLLRQDRTVEDDAVAALPLGRQGQ